MFTSMDKAWAALVTGAVSVMVMLGMDVPEFLKGPEAVAAVSSVASMLAVYFVPNKG